MSAILTASSLYSVKKLHFLPILLIGYAEAICNGICVCPHLSLYLMVYMFADLFRGITLDSGTHFDESCYENHVTGSQGSVVLLSGWVTNFQSKPTISYVVTCYIRLKI
jgi:hypothetical protein